MVLALLVVLVYGFWYFTNDRRIRLQAESYLQVLTGAKVRIKEAHFSLFRGIELSGVQVRMPGDDLPEPFFQARSLVLKYRPWNLFVNRRLETTEIICTEPTVAVTLDEKGQYGTYQLMGGRQAETRLEWTGTLPPIRVRKAKVRVYEKIGGARHFLGEQNLNMTFFPEPDARYRIVLEEDRGGQQVAIEKGSIELDLATRQYRLESTANLEGLDKVLPAKYRDWRIRYNVTGPADVNARSETAPANAALEANMVDVSLRLPDEEGGLALSHVRGLVIFDPNGVTLQNVTGQIVQAGGANFSLSGRYDGYSASGTFDLRMTVEGMILPDGNSAKGGLARTLNAAHEEYGFSGPMSVEARFQRLADGSIRYSGVARPEGMSMTYRWFPYRLEDLRGQVTFDANGVVVRQLSARHDNARVFMRGGMSGFMGEVTHDLRFDANDLALESDLEEALPREFRPIYRDLSPKGKLNVAVSSVRRPGEKAPRVEVTVRSDGQASMSFAAFPYRLEGLVGEAFIADNAARLKSVRGARGPMTCTIDGAVTAMGSDKAGVDLKIAARQLPLDDALMNALGPDTRASLKSVNPSGMAGEVVVELRQKDGGRLDYVIRASLSGAAFKVNALPYQVADATGTLTITPDEVVIKDLRGRHGKTPVTIRRGTVYTGKGIGLDLELAAVDLNMDQELFDAIPPGLQRVWQRLKPAGPADVTLSFEQDTPRLPGKTKYELALTPKDVQAVWRDFPLKLSGIKGKAVATPGLVLLDNLTADDGKTRVALSGKITYDDKSEQADLFIRAQGVPINAELLAALPGELSQLAARFKAGGSCDPNITRLRFTRTEVAPTTAPATAASAPATTSTAPSGEVSVTWDVAGDIFFRDVVADMGFGSRTLTGSIRGAASGAAEGLKLDADIDLQSILVGRQKVTDLRGKLIKSPRSSVIHVDDLQAKAYGGRLSGIGRIELGDPLRYGLRLSVEDIDLQKLFKDSLADPNAKVEMEGLLSGNVQLVGTGRGSVDRQAMGKLKIYKGKLYKLPVILGFLQVITLSLPGDSAFTDGELSYTLRGDDVTFQEIYLRGTGMSIVGSGKLDLKAEALSLNFIAGPANKLPRLSSLDELVENIAREMMEIRITGSLSKPKTETVQLRSLNEVVRRLLSPGQEKDGS